MQHAMKMDGGYGGVAACILKLLWMEIVATFMPWPLYTHVKKS
jgi:hypothetical protein